MFKRRTSKSSRNQQIKRLQAHVMSPRIAWFSFLGACSRTAKIGFGLAVVGGLGWWGWNGLHSYLYTNQEFRLQAIQLTPNSAVDERRLVEIAKIDINGTLFDCDLDAIEKSLLALPEVASAEAKREFPGTLQVKVTARQPVVWVSSPKQDPPVLPRDPESGLLVDASGFAYHCPAGQLEAAMKLPVIELASTFEGAKPIASGQKVEAPQYERGMALRTTACAVSPDASNWIDTIRQSREWAMEMTSRDGMSATFGLGDQERQMQDLVSIIDHSRASGQPVASINLIPRKHIPVRLRDDSTPRTVTVEDPEPVAPAKTSPPSRRESDLKQLLNRR